MTRAADSERRAVILATENRKSAAIERLAEDLILRGLNGCDSRACRCFSPTCAVHGKGGVDQIQRCYDKG